MANNIKRLLTSILSIVVLVTIILSNFTSTVSSLSITNITPQQGPTTGGTEVTIHGDFGQLLNISQIGTGYYHSCALSSDGKAYCWGGNVQGQLGNGAAIDSRTPVAVIQGGIPSGVTIKQISADGDHTCVIASDDKVYCWGDNGKGQLGDGTFISRNSPTAIIMGDIPSGATIEQITTGPAHTCAVASDKKIYCWGYNGGGQLGDGTSGFGTDKPIPTAVLQGDIPSGMAMKQVSAGDRHTCAMAENMKIYCWGSNGYGELGVGTISTGIYAPTAISSGVMPSGTATSQVFVGYSHTCVITEDSKIYCWGRNDDGELGNGTTTGSSLPVAVLQGDIPSGVTVKKMMSALHNCVITSDGKVYCWGRNDSGQFGDGTNANKTTPSAITSGAIPSGANIEQISVSFSNTCAVAEGKVYCWGLNSRGGLGDNSIASSYVPVCVHTTLDSTGSELPGLGCGRVLTVVIGLNGKSAECTNVVIAANGLSLTCTTSAHVAGKVDVTINDGVNVVTLNNGYEYIEEQDNNKENEDINITPPNTGSLLTPIQTAILSILSLLIVAIVVVLMRRHHKA